MKTLIVDNGTNLLEKLSDIILDEKQIVMYSDLKDVNLNSFDLIVLSGSSSMPVAGNEGVFAKEMDLIKNSNKPIVGICLGYELIIKAFGGELFELKESERGTKEVEILDKTIINNDFIEVYENHKWIAKVLPVCFDILGKSKSGPEIIRHKTLPIYGLQFHPENMVDVTDGKKVFDSIVNKITKSNI